MWHNSDQERHTIPLKKITKLIQWLLNTFQKNKTKNLKHYKTVLRKILILCGAQNRFSSNCDGSDRLAELWNFPLDSMVPMAEDLGLKGATMGVLGCHCED